MPETGRLTELLQRWSRGDEAAGALAMEEAYHELRRIAGRVFRSQRRDQTLQPTALVNELFLRLGPPADGPWRDRQHFFAVASRAMRRLLIDHGRGRNVAARRASLHGTLPEGLLQPGLDTLDAVALDQALAKLHADYPREYRVVELRYLAGMTVEEVAGILGTATGTVKRDWRFARSFLHAELRDSSSR